MEALPFVASLYCDDSQGGPPIEQIDQISLEPSQH